MPKPSHKDFSYILNMLESIQKILDYSGQFDSADDFHNDTKSFDATMMNFVVIGEVVDWFKIKSFRNIIAHNYFGIDAEEVWQIIENHLFPLKENLERIIE